MQKFLLIVLLIGSQTLHAQTADRYWWHDDGEKAEWFSQPDVYVFSTDQNTTILAPASLPGVQTLMQEAEWDGLHVMRFYPGVNASDRQNAINIVKNNPDYDCDLDVITPYPNQANSTNMWRVTDDLVQVLFEDPAITQSDVDDFMDRWDLTLEHAPFPGLDPTTSWTYLFRNNHPNRCSGRKSIDIARDIMIDDSALVRFAEPNILRLFEPYSNDSLFIHSWHIENTGQPIVLEPGAIADSDSDIQEAWAKGYTGDGVNVVVMDFGFDWNHNDMDGAYQFWDNQYDSIPIPTYPLVQISGNQHGEAVSGVIGMRKDNLYGSAGVAPDCNIGAFMFGYSPAQAVVQMQLIALNPSGYKVGIVNMSWGTYDSTNASMQSLHRHILLLSTRGREGAGIVFIAAAGNGQTNAPFYPAAYPEVISITSTTPSDSAKRYGDSWAVLNPNPAFDWGGNFGETVDFGAPGVKLQTTDFTGSRGRSQGDYYLLDRTSGAAAVASGIAALILERKPNIDAYGPYSVYELLKQGAQQIGGYNYNFSTMQPGKSDELGYGRLNACNSLNLVHLYEQQDAFAAAFRVAHLQSGEIRAYYDLSQVRGNFEIELLDLHGRQLKQFPLAKSSNWTSLDTRDLTPGIYLVRIKSDDISLSDTEKVVVWH